MRRTRVGVGRCERENWRQAFGRQARALGQMDARDKMSGLA